MHKKYKVGIVTYHKALSYGACLQAFATSYVITNKMNCIAEFIDYENKFESRQKGWGFLIKGSPKEVVMTLVKRILFKNEKCKKRAFLDFLKYQELSSVHTNVIDDLNYLKYDILVVGSDQVWNPKISNGIDDVFLLDFGKTSKKISYSSSMGGYILNEDEKRHFKNKLSHFDYISVREKHTKNQISSLVNKNIRILLDPTLLISGHEWRQIVSQHTIHYKFEKNKYILAFTIGEIGEEIINAYNYFSKKLGLPIYRIMLNTYKPEGIDKVISGATPYEFIDLIDNARFVITNSFHGTAFSINLNTSFVQIPVKNNNQRMSELLNFVGLKEQSLIENDFSNIRFEIDFDEVNKKLDKKRNDDLNWLMEVFL